MSLETYAPFLANYWYHVVIVGLITYIFQEKFKKISNGKDSNSSSVVVPQLKKKFVSPDQGMKYEILENEKYLWFGFNIDHKFWTFEP